RCLGGRESRRLVLGHQPEALSVRREQRLPQAEASVLLEDARAQREELGRDCRRVAIERRRRADALSKRFVGGMTGRAAGDWRGAIVIRRRDAAFPRSGIPWPITGRPA